MNILDHIKTPQQVKSDEYEAIYCQLNTQECHNDPIMAMAVCEEFKRHAQTVIDQLEAAVLAETKQ